MNGVGFGIDRNQCSSLDGKGRDDRCQDSRISGQEDGGRGGAGMELCGVVI